MLALLPYVCVTWSLCPYACTARYAHHRLISAYGVSYGFFLGQARRTALGLVGAPTTPSRRQHYERMEPRLHMARYAYGSPTACLCVHGFAVFHPTDPMDDMPFVVSCLLGAMVVDGVRFLWHGVTARL